MIRCLNGTGVRKGRLGLLAAMVLSAAVAGCGGSEGAGTIQVGDPQAVRSSVPGVGAGKAAAAGAKATPAPEGAASKHPKLE